MKKHELATVIDLAKREARLTDQVVTVDDLAEQLGAARHYLRRLQKVNYDVGVQLNAQITSFLHRA